MISPIFWIASGEYAFQRVGSVFRVYDRNGDPVQDFGNFFDMCDWIIANEGKKVESNGTSNNV